MELTLWLDANGLAHGFTAAQIADFHTKASDSKTALDAIVDQRGY